MFLDRDRVSDRQQDGFRGYKGDIVDFYNAVLEMAADLVLDETANNTKLPRVTRGCAARKPLTWCFTLGRPLSRISPF